MIIDPTMPRLFKIGEMTSSRVIISVYGHRDARERQVQVEYRAGGMVHGTQVVSVSADELGRHGDGAATTHADRQRMERVMVALFGHQAAPRSGASGESYGERTRVDF